MANLKTESQHGLIENNTINRSELDVQELLCRVQEASFIGYDYLEIKTIERALIALAVLNGANEVPSLSAAINFLQSLKKERDESNNTIKDRDEEIVSLEADNKRAKRLEAIFSGQGEANQGIFISPPMVQETVAALHESSAALSRVPGQQALSRRALSASAGIESLVIQFLAPVNKDQFDQAFSWRTGEPV